MKKCSELFWKRLTLAVYILEKTLCILVPVMVLHHRNVCRFALRFALKRQIELVHWHHVRNTQGKCISSESLVALHNSLPLDVQFQDVSGLTKTWDKFLKGASASSHQMHSGCSLQLRKSIRSWLLESERLYEEDELHACLFLIHFPSVCAAGCHQSQIFRLDGPTSSNQSSV